MLDFFLEKNISYNDDSLLFYIFTYFIYIRLKKIDYYFYRITRYNYI